MGCFLYYTKDDLQQTLQGGQEDRFEKYVENAPDKVTAALGNPNHPAHGPAMTYMLRNVAHNQSIPQHYRELLPNAITTLARITPSILGLVKPAQNWAINKIHAIHTQGKFGHKTRGAAFAAELIIAGQLARQSYPSVAGNASGENGKLKIYNTDRVDLGVKFTSSYKHAGPTVKHPGRASYEADILIQRPARGQLFGLDLIAIDVKHAKGGKSYSAPLESSQIERIVVGIKTGEIDEFHFVTNGLFRQEHKDLIARANEKLDSKLQPAEFDESHLTTAELRSRDDSTSKIFWHERVWVPDILGVH